MSLDRHGVHWLAGRLGMTLAALAGVGTPVSLHAPLLAQVSPQDPGAGPIVVTQETRWELFSLQDLQAAVEFDWRRDIDEVDRRDGPDRRDVEERTRETLELSGTGFIGHPNLVALDLLAEFRLTQRRLDLDDSAGVQNTDELLLNYDLAATILQKQKIPVTLYARRAQSDINRQFGGVLENVVDEYGVRVNIRDDFAPTRIQLFRRRQEQDDRAGTGDFEIDQDTVEAEGQLELGGGHTLWWDYSYDDVRESGTIRRAISFERQEANLTHTFDFGEQEQHQFRTAVRYFAETGDLDFKLFRLLERVRIEHNESLTSWYDLTEEHQEQLDIEQRRRQGVANFRHQLYESLTTTGRVGLIDLNIPTSDFESDQRFAEIIFDYVKRVPLGTLEAGLDLRYSEIEETDRGQEIPIVDAVFTFDPSGLVIIQGQAIIPTSIVVTDVSGLIIYTEGVDYEVFAFADRIEISRIPGGDIVPGQTVLVDYLIGPQPGSTTHTRGWGVDFRYTIAEGPLRGVSVYAIYFEQDEDRVIDPDTMIIASPVMENDFDELRYGIEYTIGRVFLRAEHLIRDSSLSPFDLLRLEGRYTHRVDRDNAFQLSALYQQIDRDEDDLRTATTTLTGQWSGRLTSRLTGNALVIYQIDDANRGFDSTNFEQELNLTWRYRQTEVYARFRNAFRDTDADDTMFQTIAVGMRREF